ncbi:MAG TPA: hypothetical protein VIX83_00095 [Candidatus Cybelea sp.]
MDPSTGDLAASGAAIAIYPHATGAPRIYSSPAYIFRFCGYNNHSDLFLSATALTSRGDTVLLRLSHGSNAVQQIAVKASLYSNPNMYPSVQWDGDHITMSSTFSLGNVGPVSIYSLRIAGTQGTIVGTTTLNSKKNKYTGQLWIQRKSILAVDYARHGGQVGEWKYPAGGTPRKNIVDLRGGGIYTGVAVSPPSWTYAGSSMH